MKRTVILVALALAAAQISMAQWALSASGSSTAAAEINSKMGINFAAGGGIAQAQTATFAPAVTSLVDGLPLCWLPIAANSGAAPTFSPNSLTAHPVVKVGGAALVANDIITTAHACVVYNLAATDWELQNPQTAPTAAQLPASVTGIRKSAGAGTTDTAAGVSDILGPWTGTKDSSHFPAGDGTMQTAGTSTAQTVSWVLCAAAACSTSDAVAIPFRVSAAGTSNTCYIAAGTAPTGADLIVQVTKNGSNAFTVALTAGTAANTFLTSTPTMTRAAGDVLKASITQVGSTVPGMSVMLTCTLQ